MKRKIENIFMIIFLLISLLLLFGKHFGITISHSAEGYLRLTSGICLAISIYLEENIKKNIKIMLFVLLGISAGMMLFMLATGA